MKRIGIKFLQGVVVLIGVGALVFMLWEPHIEGRNAHATLFQIYFNDPFLVYTYAASIPFFVILYQAFTLLRYIGQQRIFLLDSVRALKIIKNCAMLLVGLIVVPVVYLVIVRPGDDIAGGVAVGLFLTLISILITITATLIEKTVQRAIAMFNKNST